MSSKRLAQHNNFIGVRDALVARRHVLTAAVVLALCRLSCENKVVEKTQWYDSIPERCVRIVGPPALP